MQETCVISVYPLTENNQLAIEKHLGTGMTYLPLTNVVSKQGLFRFLLLLRKIRCEKLVLSLDDPSIRWVSSLLKVIAALTKAKKLYLFDWNNELFSFSRISICADIFKIFLRSVDNVAAIFKTLYYYIRYKNKPAVSFDFNNLSKEVLYINPNLWLGVKTGGSIGHIAGVANAIANKGYQVTYASYTHNDILSPAISQHCFKDDFTYGLPKEFNYYYNNFYIQKECKEIIHNQKFIYQRLSFLSPVGVFLSFQNKIPLILEYNGSEVWVAEHWGKGLLLSGLAKRIEIFCLQKAYKIVTISKVLQTELINLGIAENKIVFYPNCIDPQIYNPALFTNTDHLLLKKKYHLSHDSSVIMFVGTFGLWHGVDVLAKTIVEIANTNREWLTNNKICFMLVGDGLRATEAKQIIESGNASEFVRFTGLIDQHITPGYLAMASIVLSPHVPNKDGTKFFGSPTKLFEYMAMKKPIIASNLEQIGEVLTSSIYFQDLEHFDNSMLSKKPLSVLVKPGCVFELASAIKFLIDRPDVANELGENAYQEALNKYTWNIHVEKILAGLSLSDGNTAC